MKLSLLVSKVFSRSLTCSEVMALLMDQPTKTGESHAHMHTREGFRVGTPKGLKSGSLYAVAKKSHWEEEDSHLLPKTTNLTGLYVYPSGDKGGQGIYPGVYQDPDRLPSDRRYADRTGLAELSEVVLSTKVSYKVWKYPKDKMGAPIPQILEGVSESYVKNLKPVGNAKDHYQPRSKKDPTIRYHPLVDQTKIPKVPESPAHTMFPDGESMVMHLAASLLSDAGKMALRHLFMRIHPGEQKTVGIFSKAAVRAVYTVDKRFQPELVERVLEVDTTKPRDPITGRYPTTGKIKRTKASVDHVVVVLGYRATGDLNVLTCFPSKKPTGQSIGTSTGPHEDIAELTFGVHKKVKQKGPLPKLRW